MKINSGSVLLFMLPCAFALPMSPRQALRRYIGVDDIIQDVNRIANRVEDVAAFMKDLTKKYEDATSRLSKVLPFKI